MNKSTHDLLKRLLKKVKIKVFLIQPQLQVGIHDCRLFALAFCTSLALGEDLSDIKFDQARMRNHPEHCFENKYCLLFQNWKNNFSTMISVKLPFNQITYIAKLSL